MLSVSIPVGKSAHLLKQNEWIDTFQVYSAVFLLDHAISTVLLLFLTDIIVMQSTYFYK